jgi:hypothetical protein
VCAFGRALKNKRRRNQKQKSYGVTVWIERTAFRRTLRGSMKIQCLNKSRDIGGGEGSEWVILVLLLCVVVGARLLCVCVCTITFSRDHGSATEDEQTVLVRTKRWAPVGIPAASRQLVGRQVGVGQKITHTAGQHRAPDISFLDMSL